MGLIYRVEFIQDLHQVLLELQSHFLALQQNREMKVNWGRGWGGSEHGANTNNSGPIKAPLFVLANPVRAQPRDTQGCTRSINKLKFQLGTVRKAQWRWKFPENFGRILIFQPEKKGIFPFSQDQAGLWVQDSSVWELKKSRMRKAARNKNNLIQFMGFIHSLPTKAAFVCSNPHVTSV